MKYHKLIEISNNREQALWLCATGLSDGVTTLGPGIWYIPITILRDPYDFDKNTVPYVKDYNTIRYNVNSLSVGEDDYTEVSSFADLETQDKSFLFQIDHDRSLRVFVHFENSEPPTVFENLIFIGISLSFCMTNDPGGYTSEEGVFYDPRVESISELTEEVDPLFFGKTSDRKVDIVLLNNVFSPLDDMGRSNLYGNPMEILLVEEGGTYANAEKLFSGRISNVPKVGQSEIRIEAMNERVFLTRQLPVNFYNNSDSGADYYYAGLPDKYHGKPTPLIFGKVKKVPCIPLNSESSPATYQFQVCETDISDTLTRDIHEITKVYTKEGTDITAQITPDLTAGTFTVASTYVEDSNGNLMDIYADVSGYEDGSGNLVENGLEIIRLMLYSFYGYEYTSSVYNTTEWAIAEAAAYNLGYYVKDTMELRDAIDDLASSLLGYFHIQGDGKITFRKRDSAAAAVANIPRVDNFIEEAGEYDAEQFLTSVTVKYDREWDGEEFRSLTNADYESAVFAKYRNYRPKVIETFINNEADAQDFAETMMLWKKDIVPTFQTSSPLSYRTVKLNDNVTAEIKRQGGEFFGDVKAWALSRAVDLNEEKVNLRIEYIENV